nr:MAG TPA: hypothetical protein [Caudoviricetes sp.]
MGHHRGGSGACTITQNNTTNYDAEDSAHVSVG